ncbi:hypothetical protein [Pedobacter sp.]|uniref:hypothetical protein n=1 Tax=Pedobacter sp. TaxID=1411316 RepID=UPI0031E45609
MPIWKASVRAEFNYLSFTFSLPLAGTKLTPGLPLAYPMVTPALPFVYLKGKARLGLGPAYTPFRVRLPAGRLPKPPSIVYRPMYYPWLISVQDEP